MNTYKLNYATENPIDQIPGMGRSLLQVYTGEHISENEAQNLLTRIADHKWYVSEKLDRDVGFHVAAIDYVENFYQPSARSSSLQRFGDKVGRSLRSFFTAYLTIKGGQMPL